MSTAAIMMVKDEADIIGYVLDHLAYHVDEIIVADNRSTDGTREILQDAGVELIDDKEVGYYQSRKMTDLAHRAGKRGHDWILPVDADELWYVCADGSRRMTNFLSGLVDVQIVRAVMWNHIPTDKDSWKDPSPLARIKHRKTEHGALPKVACRYHHSLVIDPGNHSAQYAGPKLTVDGLCIRHFSWRTAEQYVRKIRNGLLAYRATTLPSWMGVHWRMWDDVYAGEQTEDIANLDTILEGDYAVKDHYRMWFSVRDPEQYVDLVKDPAPVAGG